MCSYSRIVKSHYVIVDFIQMLGYVIFVRNPSMVKLSSQNLSIVICSIFLHLKVDAVLGLPCMMERCL